MEANFTDLKQIALELKKELGVETHETLKLEKNSRGWNWEIKLFLDNSDSDKEAIERLEKINNELVERYQEEPKE